MSTNPLEQLRFHVASLNKSTNAADRHAVDIFHELECAAELYHHMLECAKAAGFASITEAIAAAKLPRWIPVGDRLPEEREQPYQVIVCAVKQHDPKSMYAGLNQRRFLQDWVVRRWPQNFTHWMEAMPWPQA